MLLPRWLAILLGTVLLLGLTASSIALVRTTQQQGDLEQAQEALDREVMERVASGQRVIVQLRAVERRARRTTCNYLNRFAHGEAARLRLQGFTVRLAPIACGRFEVTGRIEPRPDAPPSAPPPGVPEIVTVNVPVPGPVVTTTVAVPVPVPETIEVPVPSPPQTTTVPGPTVTAPPQTRTVPGPTVTQTVEVPPPPPPTTEPEPPLPIPTEAEPPVPPPPCPPDDLLCEVVDILTP